MAISRQGEFSSLHACIQEAIQSGGLRSLYRGLVPSVIGIVPYSGVDMAVFWTLRARWLETHPNTSKGPSVLTMLGFGAFSSVCGQLASYPMQVNNNSTVMHIVLCSLTLARSLAPHH